MVDLLFRRLAALLVAGSLVACEGGEECTSDQGCGVGQRCVYNPDTGTGVCEDCAGQETPYDGVDNDCNGATSDNDVDGDGWIAEIVGGPDCDDNDPDIVGGGGREVCGDEKDNNCDGQIDELACQDEFPPVVRLRAPVNGAFVAGTFEVRAEATDDAGLTSLSLFGRGISDRQTLDNLLTYSYTTTVDTAGIADGPLVLEVFVEDLAGNTASSRATVIVDNEDTPNLELLSPAEGTSVSGDVTIDATAADFHGIASMRATFDGAEVATARAGQLTATVRASAVDDTRQVVTVEATDRNGITATESVTVRADNTPPQIRFVQPPPNFELGGPVEVVVEATDPAGVARLTSMGATATGGPGQTTVTLRYTIRASDVPATMTELTATAVDQTRVNGGGGHEATAALPFDRLPVGPGTFSPTEVYLYGSVRPFFTGYGVVCNIATPGIVSGTMWSVVSPRVRPADGKLLYIPPGPLTSPNDEVRVFEPDPVYVDPGTGEWVVSPNWLDNDPVVPTPSCPQTKGVTDFRLDPVNGDLYYRCGFDLEWFGPNGLLTSCTGVGLEVGYDGTFLCGNGLRFADGNVTAIPPDLTSGIWKARPGGGYWVAERELDGYERWSVSASGDVARDGAYAAWPAGLFPRYGILDSAGNLYLSMTPGGASRGPRTIARLDFGQATVIYDEAAMAPACQTSDGDAIFSGP